MALVINVIKWLLWTVESKTLYKVLGRDYVLGEIYHSVLVRNTSFVNTPSKYDVDPMLVQCWSTICDAGRTSNQHWFNASGLLGCVQLSKHKKYCPLWSVLECFENLKN